MDAAMIDDARKEWMDRGHPADDFSMDKMAELWQQEEQEEMEEQAVGGNFLEEKVRSVNARGRRVIAVLRCP